MNLIELKARAIAKLGKYAKDIKAKAAAENISEVEAILLQTSIKKN